RNPTPSSNHSQCATDGEKSLRRSTRRFSWVGHHGSESMSRPQESARARRGVETRIRSQSDLQAHDESTVSEKNSDCKAGALGTHWRLREYLLGGRRFH